MHLDKRRDRTRHRPYVFVGIPFAPQYTDLRKVLENVLRPFGLNPYFADEESKPGMLLDRIRHRIRDCSPIAIFEVTDWNANVALEAGIALGMYKRVIFLSRKKPFTLLQGAERIEYQDLTTLSDRLKMAVSRFKTREMLLDELADRLARRNGIKKSSRKYFRLRNDLRKFLAYYV